MTECESAAALSSPAPGGLPTLHRDKQRSLVVFQEVRWAKRKHRARNTQQENGKKGLRDVCSMEKLQHLFTQGLDKNVTLGGKGTGSTDYVIIFWLSADLAEAKRTHRRKEVDSGFVVVQSLRCIRLFAIPWTATHQSFLSFTISQSLLKLMSTESMMPSNHLILGCPLLLLLPSIFPRIRVFSSESALHIR